MKLLIKLLVIVGLLVPSLSAFAEDTRDYCTNNYYNTDGGLLPETPGNEWKNETNITKTLTDKKIGCWLKFYDHQEHYITEVSGYVYCSPTIHNYGVFLLKAGKNHDLVFKDLQAAKDFEKTLLDNIDANKATDKKATVVVSAWATQYIAAVGYFINKLEKTEDKAQIGFYYLANPRGITPEDNSGCGYRDKDADNFPKGPDAYKYAFPFDIDN